MTLSDIITISGAIVTIFGAIFSLVQAMKAKKYSRQLKDDVQKLSLMNITEPLYRCQEEIRRLPRDRDNLPRGYKIDAALEKIWPYFDDILSSHVLIGENESIRRKISKAQDIIRSYETNDSRVMLDPYNAQCLLQEALSEIKAKVHQLDGGV